MVQGSHRTKAFKLEPGQRIGDKYIVEAFIGGGMQGEVYKVIERATKIRRAAKLFYTRHNPRDRASRSYARKLDRLRHCSVVIQYHHAETLVIDGAKVTCLFSDFVEGVLLSDFVKSKPGGRLQPFEALHVIYPIVCGLEDIHAAKEYHGDLHLQNILVHPTGIFFDIKIVDFFDHGRTSRAHYQYDVQDVIRILYEITGGRRFYGRQPPTLKAICLGLRRDLIADRYPTARHLRTHLETFVA